MAEIINLNRARKERDKARKQARAAENRAAFGRPKSAKTLAGKKAAIEDTRLDGHRLDEPGGT